MTGFDIRPARHADERAIRALLQKADLPFGDVEVGRQAFIVAVAGDRIIGAVGLEAYGGCGLLRSLAVAKECRGKGLGNELLERMTTMARSAGVQELVLLTTTAEGFFAARGFERTVRAKAPASLQGTTEFKSICPVSAVCMRKRL